MTVTQNRRPLATVKVASERLGISPWAFYDRVRQGLFPRGVVVRLGKRIMVNLDALDRFIEQGGAAV